MVSLIMTDAGYDVTDKIPLGGTNIVRQAFVSKQIDGYIEYTGTASSVFFKEPRVLSGAETYELVRDADAKDGIVWLPPMTFNNTYCLMMKRAKAEELGIKSMSDLAKYVADNPGKLRITSNNEFFARPDGLPKMIQTYGFKLDITTVTQMDSGLIYLALKDDKIDVGLGFTTDGRIRAYDFVALADDKEMFPAYNPCMVLHKSFLDKDPDIAPYFEKLGAILSDEAITELNFLVAENKEDPRKVAETYLRENKIIK
jgi:osmoprotectant transport system substrate-binding protein